MKTEPRNAEQPSAAVLKNALPRGPGQYVDAPAWTSFVSITTPHEWSDREYRQAAMESHVGNSIAWQVRINREERGLTQQALAQIIGTKQPAVSKLEDPDGGDMLLSRLVKVAHAFDCALLVKFVPYTEFAAMTADVRSERLFACGFGEEQNKISQSDNSRSAHNLLGAV